MGGFYSSPKTQARVVQRAAGTLPQSGQSALFTVSGGKIMLVAIVGEVTSPIQNQLNNTKLVANPTVGSDRDMCAVADLANAPAGLTYALTGSALEDAPVLHGQGIEMAQVNDVMIPAGTIDLNCAASNTGEMKWTAIWYPIDEGAELVAA